MKPLLLGILFIIAVFIFVDCGIERSIQVKPILLTVVFVKKGAKDERGQMYWITWADQWKTAYEMYCTCPSYKIGDTQTFLITR